MAESTQAVEARQNSEPIPGTHIERGMPLLTAKDLAQRLGISGKNVYDMVADGRIPKHCIVRMSERHYKFHPDRIQKIIDEGGFVRQNPGDLPTPD